jgi:hypothetical protein
MNSKYYTAFASLLTGGFVALSAVSAQAFSFTTNLGPGSAAPKGNIWLKSVTYGGTTVNSFSLVDRAQIIQNDAITKKHPGAASSDRGDNASGINVENPTAGNIVTSLGNLNLNNIIDTEDTGSFKMNLFFQSAVDTLFFWERGMNSTLDVQAIDASGNLLGNLLTLNSKNWSYAGFGIDTTEIEETQRVGSFGLTLDKLGVSGPIAGIQVISKKNYNGPDFKVVGTYTKSVPEPATIAGIGLVAGLMAVSRRRKAAQDA